MIEQLAVLVYGVLAIVAALVLSSQAGSPLATALVVAAAGFTYLFQVVQLMTGKASTTLWALAIGALLVSVAISLGAFDRVL